MWIELIKLITFCKNLEDNKKRYQKVIINQLPMMVRNFRMRPGSITAKILAYHFQMISLTDTQIYDQIKNEDSQILDYLNINNENEVKEKITQYLEILSFC